MLCWGRRRDWDPYSWAADWTINAYLCMQALVELTLGSVASASPLGPCIKMTDLESLDEILANYENITG